MGRDGRSVWRVGGCVGGRGGGKRCPDGDIGLAKGIGGARLSDPPCNASSEPMYEVRFVAGGENIADGVRGDMAVKPLSVISSPDSDPGPGEVMVGRGGGTGRAVCQG